LTAIGSLAALAGGLIVIDPRFRDQATRLLRGGGPTEELAGVGSEIVRLATLSLEALKDQSIEHAPLTLFAVAAVLLLFFILRIRL
jgi:hypothetical protein